MGAKKEAKQVTGKNGPAAQPENGVTDTVTVANGQKVGVLQILSLCTVLVCFELARSVYSLQYPGPGLAAESHRCA